MTRYIRCVKIISMNTIEREKSNLMVKIPLDLKQKALEKARANDLTLSQVVRKMLDDYVKDVQGKLNF